MQADDMMCILKGAELIEELSHKQIQEQLEAERKILEKIKYKMDRIKASQQKVQGPSYKEPSSHFTATAPLAQDSSPEISSPVSPQGFHTPVEDEPPATPRAGSLLQAPTPTSAIATASGLEGYLEPQRMSFGSPPMSELLPRIPSMDDSFPVFSPPPYGAVVSRRSGPPWLPLYSTPRHSIVSPSTPRSHHTSGSEGPVVLRRRRPADSRAGNHESLQILLGAWVLLAASHHHCHIVMLYQTNQSFISDTRTAQRVGTQFSSIRSGDYYMFEDLDEELDLITEQESEETSLDSDEDEAAQRGRGMTVSKFLSSAMKTDIGAAADMALERTSPRPRSVSRLDGDDTSLLHRATDDEHSTWRSCSSLHVTQVSNPLSAGSWSCKVGPPLVRVLYNLGKLVFL
ncbi:hypothetical protein J6590_038106 [Homalodisca vitripennis]|nr:hypothetical protein J6590_038106 [Homalodisca vitripennis]